MKNFTIHYRLTAFDKIRSLKVLADDTQQAKECVKDIYGRKIAILRTFENSRPIMESM